MRQALYVATTTKYSGKQNRTSTSQITRGVEIKIELNFEITKPGRRLQRTLTCMQATTATSCSESVYTDEAKKSRFPCNWRSRSEASTVPTVCNRHLPVTLLCNSSGCSQFEGQGFLSCTIRDQASRSGDS